MKNNSTSTLLLLLRMNTLVTFKPRLSIIFLVLISIGLTAQNSADLEEQIDAIFSEYDDIAKPGAAVAVVRDGRIVFKKGYGSANLEYNIPVTPSTIFHIASVSKQFTVFSIMLLAREGKLSFEDDIRKHIPEVPEFGETITLRHLAGHTSGMRDQWDLLNMAGWRWDDVITKEHILKMVSRQKDLNFKPGEEFSYCNTGFTLLAEVVARVSGKSFAEFTQEEIFEPLKMSNTLFYDDHQKIVKNRAYSYFSNDSGFHKSVLNYANVGATSLFTTVEDLCLWAMNFSKLTIGDEKIIEQMNTLAKLNNGETFGGAYGQFINKHRGLNQIQHGGGDAGFRTYLGRFPDQKFSVVVLSNFAGTNPVDLSMQVTDLYLNEFYPEESPLAEIPKPVEFMKLPKEQLKKFNGHFWNEEGAYARKIYLLNDTLRYFRGNGNESMLIPIGSNKFQMMNVGVDLTVEFETNDKARTMIVVINGGDPIISHEFVPPKYSSDDLKEFTGTFYSPELSTYYTIVQKEDQLIVTHARISDFEISPVKNDSFSGNSGNIDFVRNDEKTIVGLKVTTGRVRDLMFEKVE